MTAGISPIADHPLYRRREVVSSEGDMLGFMHLLHGMSRFEREILLTDQNNFYATFTAWMYMHDVELWGRLDHQWFTNHAWHYLVQLSVAGSKDIGPCLSPAVLYSVLFLGAQAPLAHLASCDYCAFVYDALVQRQDDLDLIESELNDPDLLDDETGDLLSENLPPDYPGAS